MKPDTWWGSIETLSSTHHGGDQNTGNVRLLRREKVRDRYANRVVAVPMVTGNAIRGVLRRKLMHDLLERLDYGPRSTKLHHALHAGGLLESTSDVSGALDLPSRRRLQQAIPPLALLGTAILNDMLPGQLTVEIAYPNCQETKWRTERLARRNPGIEAVLDTDALAFASRAFRDFTFTTRRDDIRDSEADSHQMIVTFEYFVTGTTFLHGFELRHPSDLLRGAVATMFRLWREDPHIGGKNATGYGHLDHDYPTLDATDTTAYDEYVANHTEEIREVLDDLAKRLEGNRKKVEGLTNAAIPF